MDTISLRYGESLTLPLDTGNTTDVSADIYIGKPGEQYILTQNISLTLGLGTFTFTPNDTMLPLDTYYFQINVTGEDGYIEKYPETDGTCGGNDSGFPRFVVAEALDLMEVVS